MVHSPDLTQGPQGTPVRVPPVQKWSESGEQILALSSCGVVMSGLDAKNTVLLPLLLPPRQQPGWEEQLELREETPL